MSDFSVGLSTHGAQDFRELSRKLRRLGRGDLQKKFRDGIAEAGKPVLNRVRQEVLSMNVKGSPGGGSAARQAFAVSRARSEAGRHRASRRHAGLRSSTARATGLSITDKGVRFVCRSGAMPPDQRELPRHLNSSKGWNHPLFGDKEQWFHEQGHPWFEETIRKDVRDFHDGILKKMEEVKRELNG